MKVGDLRVELQSLADTEKAVNLQRFFKTGAGEYGEGDRFLGVAVPVMRKLCKKFVSLNLAQIQELLNCEFHECRMAGVLILSYKYPKSDDEERRNIYELYLRNVHMGRINNWDLVDVTTPGIVGEYLLDKSHDVLFEMAESENLWERRVAVLATFQFIKNGDADLALAIARKLLRDDHDLIQKAVGWMLREVGKRVDRRILLSFLDDNAVKMPRVTLRYAIEHLPESERAMYLSRGKRG